ncbi:exonuclease domain-containing protein [Saccharibacillus endophyticus]|uniref:DNA polymerase III subunit epsilon n=1 Tax=Saccharibacillus endophyticus TaxID=2060666 RepID=A0ABQ1ZUI5_9BACL|nr:exonuclease domain-containing protein [Saccharibacillus endophyticus]GGH76914.1 DNA polymerase III subunit epsilon [Saccharibacillus endophyticus]
MDFVAIDFETANSKRASVCAVGLVEVRGGRIVDEYYTLVNPHDDFDYFCIAVHGITPDQVENAPSFAEIWPEMKRRIEGRVLVAHNASFDMSVLRRSAEEYGLELPHIQYMCSFLMSRKIWPTMPNHKLNTVAKELGLSAFKHHDAIEDARTSAKIMLRCSTEGEASDCDALAARYGYRIGQITQVGEHVSFSASAPKSNRGRNGRDGSAAANSSPTSKKKPLPASNRDADPSNPLYGKRIVFSGRMSSVKREEALRRTANLGAFCTDSVEWKTDYLVVGRNDYAKYRAGGYSSSKTQAAEKLAAGGSTIQILCEDDFTPLLEEIEFAALRASKERRDG